MKVMSIIAAALSTISFITSCALIDECKSDEYTTFMVIMLIMSLSIMAFSAFSIIFSFKKK